MPSFAEAAERHQGEETLSSTKRVKCLTESMITTPIGSISGHKNITRWISDNVSGTEGPCARIFVILGCFQPKIKDANDGFGNLPFKRRRSLWNFPALCRAFLQSRFAMSILGARACQSKSSWLEDAEIYHCQLLMQRCARAWY